ncbi:MAG: encapsulin [Cetobacterium sp.]
MPYDDENLELSLGMDYSIGYQDSDELNVKLFITSSFAFRVLDKNLVVIFE